MMARRNSPSATPAGTKLTAIFTERWEWAEPELNRRHTDFQSVALPTELSARRISTAGPPTADRSFGGSAVLRKLRILTGFFPVCKWKPPLLIPRGNANETLPEWPRDLDTGHSFISVRLSNAAKPPSKSAEGSVNSVSAAVHSGCPARKRVTWSSFSSRSSEQVE